MAWNKLLHETDPTASPTFANLTLSGITSGSVIFAGISGILSQNNANFYWDTTYTRLLIGPRDISVNYSLCVTKSGTFNVPAFGTYSNTVSDMAYFYLFRGRGTTGNIAPVQINDPLGTIRFAGMYSTAGGNVVSGIGISGYAEDNWGPAATDGAGYLTFETKPNGTSVLTERMRVTSVGNFGFNQTTFGTSAVGVLAVGTKTAPTSSPSDCFQMYSTDIVAGNAAPHFRTELGNIIKLYQQTFISSPNAEVAALKTAVDAIRTILINNGLMAAA